MDNRVVIFTKYSATIKHGIDPAKYVGNPNVLVNPVYPSGVPPQYWKKMGDIIVEMTDKEKKDRDDHLVSKEFLMRTAFPKPVPLLQLKHYLIIISTSAVTTGLIELAIKYFK